MTVTIPTVPAESQRPLTKPTRSMTHPLRDPKASRRKAKQGAPFDPEDLSRRLNAHLVEQKERADTQRRNRQARADAEAGLYRHVPTSAAAAFERTMTPDTMRNSPKIAQPAIRAHLEVLKESPAQAHAHTQPHLTILKQTQLRDQETLERQLVASRNQFQWGQDLENADEMDRDRDLFKPPQRTFAEFAYLTGRTRRTTGPRPLSTGDMVWEDAHIAPHVVQPKPKVVSAQARNERFNDWAQRDDERKEKTTNGPLRKRESNWILSGIKSMKQHDRGTENNNDISPPSGSSANLPKMRGGIFARFKRNPS